MVPPFAFEIIATPESATPLVGRRFDLKATFSVGRGPTNDLVLVDDSISRRHFRFIVDGQKLRVQDLGSENGTSLNGKTLRERSEPLVPGDCIGLRAGYVLRIAGEPLLALKLQDPFLQAVEAAPHDDGRWQVWADQLLEAGDPLGARISIGHGRDARADAHVLTTLNDEVTSGALAVEWSHGFMQRAVVRNMSLWQATSWDGLLRRLVSHPLAHFLMELEVDALSFGRGVHRSGLQLDRRPHRRLTRRPRADGPTSRARAPSLRAEPSAAVEPAARHRVEPVHRRAAQARCEQWPHLGRAGGVAAAGAGSTPARVSVTDLDVGAQRALKEDQANLIGSTTDLAFGLVAPEQSAASQVGIRIDLEHGLWWVTDIVAEAHPLWHRQDTGLRVNGRECIRHRLRPGDVLEVAPGLTFKLVME